jgi:thioredoxin-related protein
MAILAHLLLLFSLVCSSAEDPFKTLSLADALTQAGAAHKVVMVDFFTTWCPPCKHLDAVTWKDERVRAWLAANTVALKLDAEKEHATAKKYRVSAYPTMVFLRPDGTEFGRIVGFKGPDDFLRQAGVVLAKKSSVAEEGPFKQLSLADALTQAGAAKKVVMIDYFTTWCGPCKQLDSETWKDERVRAWLAANTVALKLDAEKEVETAGKHHVQAYPTMLFLRPDGTELGRIVGFRGAEDFVKQAGDVLAGKGRIDQLQGQLAAGGGSDLMLRNDLGDELAQAGRDAEALEQYLYCWDHGVDDPGFRGVRASFLLGDIVSLGRSHPPALDALRQRRDACEAAVTGGGWTFSRRATSAPEQGARQRGRHAARL